MTETLFNLSETDLQNLESKPNFNSDFLKNGYNFQATNFIVKNIADVNKAVYLDTEKCFKSPDLSAMRQYLVQTSMDKAKVISGEVPVSVDQTFLLTNILFCGFIDDIEQKQLVVPLTLMSGDKENHALVLYANKNNDDIDITILEQHAMQKAEKDYNKSLDFSSEIKEILSVLKTFLTDELGFNVTTRTNSKPICREKNVCGIVALELCSQILKNNIYNPNTITFKDIEYFHKNNVNLYKKHLLKKGTVDLNKTDMPIISHPDKTRE